MADDGDGDGDGVEQYRDFIVDGDIYQALDLSRRLLQLDGDDARRADAALLLLDRLRSNRADSSDHANALLRVLANYATPTKELTEELLSLLFFCDHRVQIIHHLSKLTYQSRECVWLVVDAYIELLSSDRSLLVPILGSLADLPLVTTEKSLVVDATENLLDAASEEDIPAVVQSLLSMLVPAAAPRIVTKIRRQCNRLTTTTTLSLTFDVIMRHAVAGSGALTAFLRVIRHSETLTPFDVIFLALLLSRPSENAAAVRVVSSLAPKGVVAGQVVHDTLQCLRNQKWHDVFLCFVRLSSALLSACFNTRRSPGISTTVQSVVDILGYLVSNRTAAQEEALSLMMSVVSQPQRLLLSVSRKRFIAPAQMLCWDVAHAVASKLANIATTHTSSLAPFAHIFLDHLYGIAASATQSFSQGDELIDSRYPSHILARLCRTMVLLAKHEPGMVSLLMITIQKQLVVPNVGGIGTAAHSLVQVKQLMAIFLAGEMLTQGVGERTDRSSLVSWIQKQLVSATASDETTAHVVRLLGSGIITSMLTPADRDASASLLTAASTRHGFEVKKQSEIAARFQSASMQSDAIEYLAGLSDQTAGWVNSSLVWDVITYVRVAKLGEPPVGWHGLDDHDQSRSTAKSVMRSVQTKTNLLQVFAEVFMSTQSGFFLTTECDAQDEKALVCSFALPSVTENTFDYRQLPRTLWCYVCALQLSVFTTNILATKHTKSVSDTVRQRKRLLNRVQVCWTLHKRLKALINEASSRLKKSLAEDGQSQQERSLVAWAKLQVDLVEKPFDTSQWLATTMTSSSLCSLGERLSLQAVSAVFEGLWKQQASEVESGLEIELFRAFPARLLDLDGGGDAISTNTASIQKLVATQDGKRTLKYLARRLLDYCELLVSLDSGSEEDDIDDQEPAVDTRRWVLEGVTTLCEALCSIIGVCRDKQTQRAALTQTEDGDCWEETAMELFAKGASEVRLRHSGIKRTMSVVWSSSCQIIFSSLVNAAVQAKHGEVVCELMDVLLSLSAHTRIATHLSKICLGLLHCPFPWLQSAGSAPKLVRKLPLLDPTASALLTNLLRPMPRRFHHLAYLIVGTWAIPSTLRVGLTHVAYILECADTLVLSSISKSSTTARTKSQRGRQAVQHKASLENEPDAEKDIDGWIARDGEHRVLKNLTHDSVPLFLETVIACLTTAPLRAVPLPATDITSDANPFDDLIATLALVCKCLQIVVKAEISGFTLPQRTLLSILRCGPAVLRNTAEAIRTSVMWREEGVGENKSGDLQHLHSLLDAADSLVKAVQDVAVSFEERVVLTMQKNAQASISNKDNEDVDKRSSSGHWASELLKKTYRSQFQRRKPLSRSEAKLLPYFTHSAEQLKAFIVETSTTYRQDLSHTGGPNAASQALEMIRLRDEQLEDTLMLLTPRNVSVDDNTIDAMQDLETQWSRISPTDLEDEGGNYDEGSDSNDDDNDEDDHDVDSDDVVVSTKQSKFENSTKMDTMKRKNAAAHTLAPQKKRVKDGAQR